MWVDNIPKDTIKPDSLVISSRWRRKQGQVWRGMARHGKALANYGEAWRSMAKQGETRHDEAKEMSDGIDMQEKGFKALPGSWPLVLVLFLIS